MMGVKLMKGTIKDMQIPESGARQAANAIVRLINSRPRSPCYQEIEAIIDKFAVRPLTERQPHTLGLDEYGPDLTK